MKISLLEANLIAYGLQTSLLLLIGCSLPRILGLKFCSPALRLRYWRVLLLLTLILPALQPWTTHSIGPSPTLLAGSILEVGAVGSSSRPELAPVSWWWAVPIFGISVMRVGWLFVGFAKLRQLSRRATSLQPLPDALSGLAKRLGVGAEWLSSDRISMPMTFGMRRPVILLPQGFFDLPCNQQRDIACHELVHVQRRDWGAVVFEELLRSILWFHPAVWVLLDRIHLCREQIVDSSVIELTREKQSYLRSLWAYARTHHRNVEVPRLAFLNRSHLYDRVALMTQEVPMSRTRTYVSVSSLAALVSLTMIFGMIAFPLVAATKSEPLHVEGDVNKPKKISAPQPVYPEAARKDRITGAVVVQTTIDEQGNVAQTKIVQSVRDDLDAAALDAIRQWKFEPATLDGEPVSVYYNLTINFRLKKDDPQQD